MTNGPTSRLDARQIHPLPSICVLGWGLRGGAFANLGATLVHGFREVGWEAELLVVHSPTTESTSRYADIPYRVLDSRRISTSVPALVKYVRQEAPDILLPLSTMVNIPAIVARGVSRRNTAVVVTEHMDLSQATSRDDGASRTMRIAPTLVRALYPHADGLVSVNARALEDPILVRLLPRLPHTVIGNPYTWDVVERAELGRPHPWLTGSHRPPTFVATGRLVKRKGFDTAIRAIAKLRDQSIEARLVVLGDGEERSALEQLAGELGLADWVDLPGFSDNPFPSIAAADAFILSSVVEGSPMVLLEAMPLGTPIVATSAGGTTAEILNDGHSGLIVPDGDLSALARALEIVIRDPRRARALGAEARRVSEDRSPARVARRYVDFFADVLAARKLS